MENDSEKQLAITLNNAQRDAARAILDHVRGEIDRLSNGDADVLFAARRYIKARLQLDERGAAQQRGRLRTRLFDRQQGKCTICAKPLAKLSGAHVHRGGPGGYTEENTILVHPECHERHHRD